MYTDEVYEDLSSVDNLKCEGRVIENETLNECDSEEISREDAVRVPVVLGEFTVQFHIESKIKLPVPALEIKRIKKNVYLTKCSLVTETNVVFIEGLVRKNIEYAAIDCVTPKAITGDIKHATVHMPFKCAAEIPNMQQPKLESNYPDIEISYLDEKNKGIDIIEKELIGEETFNRRIYFELKHSSIYEADIINNPIQLEYHPIEHKFQYFIEKEVVCLTIKLLQTQEFSNSFVMPVDRCGC